MPNISLALVTYNQIDYLRQFVSNYLRHCPLGKVPLLVVNDGSTDGTRDYLDSLQNPHMVILHCPHVSIAHARNHALKNASTAWLAFSDTDCRLDSDYFEKLVDIPHLFPDCAAVEGAVHPPIGLRPPFCHFLTNLQGGMYVTANMVFSVEAARRIGGFDEAFANYREDVDLGLRLLENGGSIPFCSELRIIHPYIPRGFFRSLLEAFTHIPRLVESELRLYRKHPTTYSRVRHHPDFRSTLHTWCTRQTWMAFRDCRRFFRDRTALPSEAPRDLSLPRMVMKCMQALTVALAEQVGFTLQLLGRWKSVVVGGRT